MKAVVDHRESGRSLCITGWDLVCSGVILQPPLITRLKTCMANMTATRMFSVTPTGSFECAVCGSARGMGHLHPVIVRSGCRLHRSPAGDGGSPAGAVCSGCVSSAPSGALYIDEPLWIPVSANLLLTGSVPRLDRIWHKQSLLEVMQQASSVSKMRFTTLAELPNCHMSALARRYPVVVSSCLVDILQDLALRSNAARTIQNAWRRAREGTKIN
jgi:hypothetical protein